MRSSFIRKSERGVHAVNMVRLSRRARLLLSRADWNKSGEQYTVARR